MKTHVYLLVCALSLPGAMGQVSKPDPFPWEGLTEGLATPLIAVSELIGQVRSRGIAFDLGDQQIAEILKAAAQGKRDPNEVAVLITACLHVCQNCRARDLTPMTADEIKRLTKWGFTPKAVIEEARVRTVKDLQMTEAAANDLRSAGVKEEVIAFLIPDDRIALPPMIGYKELKLQRADEYDVSAPEGFLKVSTELQPNAESEFVFKHNALYVRSIKGADPVNLSASFNKPAPRNVDVDSIDLKSGVEDEKSLRLGKKKLSPISVTKEKDADNRCAFRISLANRDTSHQQRYSFYVRWRVMTAPTANPPARKPLAGQ